MDIREAVTKYKNNKGIRFERASKIYSPIVLKFLLQTGKELGDIDNDDVTAFQMLIKSTYEDSTQAIYASALRDFFDFAKGRGWSNVNTREIGVPRVIEKVPVYVVQSEFQTLCDIAKNDPVKLLVLHLLWYTGVRCQELCDIKIENMELLECCMKIKTEKTFRPRYVFWPPDTNELIKEVIGTRTEGPLFSESGITKRTIERWIKSLVKEAGIKKDIVPHSFRHGFVHENLNIGTDLPAIQAMAGHLHPESIHKYTKRLDDDIKDVARESIRKRAALLKMKNLV